MLIGELAERSGVSARMLRHYDAIGLVSPLERSAGGFREYSEADVRRLFQVEVLKCLGLSLAQIAAVLADLSFSPDAVVAQLLERTRERITHERALLDRLEQVRASGPRAWTDVLDTIGLIRGLSLGSAAARQRLVFDTAVGEGAPARVLADAVLAEADPIVAGTLHWALERLGDDALPVLTEGLHSDDPERRRRAAAALAELGSPAALAVLAGVVGNADPAVNDHAALATGNAGNADAVPVLIAMVVAGRNDVEASAALEALAGGAVGADAVSEAIAAALGPSDPPARQRLSSTLARIPGPRAEALLRTLTGDPSREVALTAAFVLTERDPDA